jgi:hypothetical protein
LNPRTGDWLREAPEGDRPRIQTDPDLRFPYISAS